MSKLGNLAARFAVAIVVVPFLLLAMYQDRPEWTWGVVFVASLIAMHEFFAMTLEDKVDRYASMAVGAAAVAVLYWVPFERGGQLLPMFIATVPMGIYYLFRFGDQETVSRRWFSSTAGILYAGVLTTFMALIKRDFKDGDMIVLILAVPWISDTFAYFAGRAFGKRKLYAAVSPGKTIAGGIGGLVGACVAAGTVNQFLMDGAIPWHHLAVLAIVGGALCQIGDLMESLLKRSTGVKDSGNLLPGHGGILDRIDAVIVYAPFVYLYLRAIG